MRLQEEIMKESTDHSLFASRRSVPWIMSWNCQKLLFPGGFWQRILRISNTQLVYGISDSSEAHT
jgi:hypothetical protein